MQKRYFQYRKPSAPLFRANLRITAPQVMVIDEDGSNIGVMPTSQALARAQERDLDLIEVSPKANPPVCRIMNFGKWQYLQSQKIKKQKTLDTKIVRLSFKIGEHDRLVRLNQTNKFITKGHKVKVELRLRGREKAYPDQAKEMVSKFIQDITVPYQIEAPVARSEGTINGTVAKK